MRNLRERERVHFETAAEWRVWLVANHARADGVWLVFWKPATGRPRVTYEEAINDALCFGWVDSQSSPIDAERSMLWFAPRRKGSAWARTNKARVERLERDGYMTDAGRRVIERAKADGTWAMFDSVDDMIVPDDLSVAFDALAGSREKWESFPPSVRRLHLGWIVQAKRPETRARRVAVIAESASRGERALQPRGD